MNIIVCVKQVNDPEAPVNSFQIDQTNNTVVPPAGMPPVISTFDEYAVEAAIRIKEKLGGKIIVLSLGTNLLRDVVKKPLSMGADELVLLEDPAYVDGDSWSTAYALAMAIKKIGQFDMVLCGRQAADWDSGQVGIGIADGFEIIEASLPVLITLSNEHPAPRYPNVKGIMLAKRKEPIIWKPGDIGIDPAKLGTRGRKAKVVKLYQPLRESKCEIVSGDTPEDAATKLADRLRISKVL
jgi:electron transfer flavoprotein beta subunit